MTRNPRAVEEERLADLAATPEVAAWHVARAAQADREWRIWQALSAGDADRLGKLPRVGRVPYLEADAAEWYDGEAARQAAVAPHGALESGR